MTPRASIVIPVFNNAVLTKSCLDALFQEPLDAEVLVVDDGSSDETAVLLEGYGERITVVRNDINRGFAYAVNRGADAAVAEQLIFLNNDTLPRRGWLDALLAHADEHPEAGIIGAKLLGPDGRIQHAGVAIGQHRYPYHLYAGFRADHPAVCRPRSLQIVTGACILVRREVFDALEGFDEAFVNSMEDVDLCLRAGEAGYEVHYCPSAVLEHLETATRGRFGDYLRQTTMLWESRWRDRVRPDDLALLAEDGMLRARYDHGNRLVLEIDPLIGTFDELHTGALEQAIAESTARWIEVLDELERARRQSRSSRPLRVESRSDGQLAVTEHPLRWSDEPTPYVLPRYEYLRRKVSPLELRVSRDAPARINVVYEGFDESLLFAGHAGMLQLGAQLAASGARVRLLAVDVPGTPAPEDWRPLDDMPGGRGLADVEYVDVSDRRRPVIANPDDRWIATSWWTMHIAHAAAEQLGAPQPLWIQQEYEPSFYPTGSYAALARAAYELPHRALISSEILRAHFEHEHLGVYADDWPAPSGGVPNVLTFENPLLAPRAPNVTRMRRRGDPRLLVYLRPATRNLFEVSLAALDLADRRGWIPADVEITGVGGLIDGRQRYALTTGRLVHLFDRVSPARYLGLLNSNDVGVALQDSPHPGLVALEMAASGMTTVTSTFDPCKTADALRALSDNLVPCAPTPDAVAEAIRRCVDRIPDVNARIAGSAVRWARTAADAFPPALIQTVRAMLER